MQQRPLLTALGLMGVGIVLGVVLVSSLGSNAIESLFAAGLTDLGAKQAPAPASAAVKAINDQFVAVSNAVTNSVVSISVKAEKKSSGLRGSPQDFFRFFGPDGMQEDESPQMPEESEGSGSGVLLTADGYIVTNNHVVEDAAEDGIKVMTFDQKEYKAKLVGRDPLTDLAVLKIDGSGFAPAHFAQRSEIRVGEWVVAVGNPLGLTSTVTTGIISATGRGIGIVGSKEDGSRNRFATENFIQTDAAINPGNSGGGLFNLNGSLVGINTAIASRWGVNAGYGFAIPIDMVKSVALDLIEDGKIQRGYIGIEITSVDETTAKTVGLPKVSGVMVNRVVKDGGAQAAGVEEGDVIMSVDGTPVKTSGDLQNQIVLHRAGDKVNLKLWRDGKEIAKSVVLKPVSDDGSFADVDLGGRAGGPVDMESSDPVTFKGLGFTAAELTEEARKDLQTSNGVLVTKVDMRGAVARRGLRQGCAIVKADGQSVSSPGQLKKILDKKNAGDGVLFVIKTKDGKQAITVEMPES
ncbi:MAG: PDZ domain-containing protein [Candidatus Kapabacteria bacterium]|nr:PDZ domain-containing protein [Candidatus Kapabacteria bacterium]